MPQGDGLREKGNIGTLEGEILQFLGSARLEDLVKRTFSVFVGFIKVVGFCVGKDLSYIQEATHDR